LPGKGKKKKSEVPPRSPTGVFVSGGFRREVQRVKKKKKKPVKMFQNLWVIGDPKRIKGV